MVRNRKWLSLVLAACASIAGFALIYPVYVIRPFRAQEPNELAAALVVRSVGPWFAMGAAAVAVVAAVWLWRSLRHRLARVLAMTGAGVTVLCAVLTQVNIFELMFHRIDSVETSSAAEAKLDSDDMVLAIRVGGQARAYPIRMMGYHHIVNDWVGGVPVAATY